MGGFSRIEDAIAAALDNGVIELCWTDMRDGDPIKLPPRPLTLRAGRGFRPVWNSTGESVSALSARAPLTLEGSRFESPCKNLSSDDSFFPRIPLTEVECREKSKKPKIP